MGLRTMREIRFDKNLVHAVSIHIDQSVFRNIEKEDQSEEKETIKEIINITQSRKIN